MKEHVRAAVVREVEQEIQRYLNGRHFAGRFSNGDSWGLTITSATTSFSLDIDWDEDYWEFER